MLKNGIKIALLFLFLLPVLHIEGKPRTEKKVERIEERLRKKERKEYEKRRKAAVKHRYSIQTQEVQDRMKESRKKADKFNKSRKDPFYKELFKKKRKKKHKSKRRPK